MTISLSNRTGDRNNNFRLIRLLAAAFVLFSHSYPLTGSQGEPLAARVGFTLGHLAVDVFFITSGFLVTGSLHLRKDVVTFVWCRVLRIVPALAVAVFFCAFILGPIYTNLSLPDYFGHHDVYGFFYKNTTVTLARLQMELPGVFLNNPYRHTVNGSLWTLPWEARMYLVLTILGLATYSSRPGLPTKWHARFAVLVAVIAVVAFLSYPPNPLDPIHNAFRFLIMFFVGSAFWLYQEKILLSHRLFAFFLLILLVFSYQPKTFPAMYCLLLGYLVIYLAYVPSGIIRQFNRIGDYSYGVYIYAFPVQQAIAASLPGIGVRTMFWLSLPITLALAIASWHFIERPALRLKAVNNGIIRYLQNSNEVN